jgi:hypothetical protein
MVFYVLKGYIMTSLIGIPLSLENEWMELKRWSTFLEDSLLIYLYEVEASSMLEAPSLFCGWLSM